MRAPLTRGKSVPTGTGGQGAMPLWKPRRRRCRHMYLLGTVALRRAWALYAPRTAGIEADMKGNGSCSFPRMDSTTLVPRQC